MADDDTTPGSGSSPEDDFQELIRQLFGGGAGDFDPEQLSRLSGMNIDPAMMQAVMRQLQGAFASAAPADAPAAVDPKHLGKQLAALRRVTGCTRSSLAGREGLCLLRARYAACATRFPGPRQYVSLPPASFLQAPWSRWRR